MIPCLYGQSETAFTSNGIGKLSDCISCSVTEERNGIYELAMEYPIDGIHGNELVENNIIYAQPAYNKDPQPFRIYKVTTPMDGKLQIDARHVSYQLNYITVSPTTVVSTTDQQPVEAFKALKKNASVDCPFDFETDISSTAYFGILEPVSFRCALGGVDGSMLDTFGGEYEWDKYTVKLHKARGADNGVRIVYGKNLVDFQQEKNIEDVITGVHPFWKDPETTDITELPELVVTLSSHDSPYEKIGLLDCSSEFEEEPTWEQMRSYARSYLNDTNLTEPSIDIDIDFAQLWLTSGYQDVVEAEQVSLCDTVHVFVTRLGVEVDTKVTQTVYDVLAEKYTSITLSNSAESARNKSFSLSIMTTSQVKTMIAMTDNSIRLSVSKTYATKATLENDYSTTVEIKNWIEVTEEAITLAYTEKLRNEYSTTTQIEAMIKLSEEGIEATYVKNGEVRSRFAMEDDKVTIDSGTITFNSGTLIINSKNLTLDSSGNATFSGNLSAPSGNIGGWTIGSKSLYNGPSSLGSSTNGTYLGTDGLYQYNSGNYVEIEEGRILVDGSSYSSSNWSGIRVGASSNNVIIYNSGIYVQSSSNEVHISPSEIDVISGSNVRVALSTSGITTNGITTGNYTGQSGTLTVVTDITESGGVYSWSWQTIRFSNGVMVTSI